MKYKRVLTSITALCLFFTINSEELIANTQEDIAAPEPLVRKKKVFVGLKLGGNSSIYYVDDLKINGLKLKHPQSEFKMGHKGVLFFRFNIGHKNFLQPEFSYQQMQCEVQFNNQQVFEGVSAEEFTYIKSKINLLEFPLLYGYNFLNDRIYGCSFLIGPKVKYTLNQETPLTLSSGNHSVRFSETLYPLSYSGVVGLSVTIDKIFFDFHLEIGITNTSKSIYIDPNKNPTSIESLVFKRRCEAISFTIGAMF